MAMRQAKATETEVGTQEVNHDRPDPDSIDP